MGFEGAERSRCTARQNNCETSDSQRRTKSRKNRKYSPPAIASIGPKGTCAPKPSAVGSPSGVSEGGATAARLPEIFSQRNATANHAVPTTAPPKIEKIAPCQPQ